jgi:hypothetical protein
MTMPHPVARLDMNLNITRPRAVPNPDFRIKEIRAGIRIKFSRVNHRNRPPVNGFHVFTAPKSVLPNVVHKSLHGSKMLQY